MKSGNFGISVLLFIGVTTIYFAGSFSKIPFGDAVGFVLDTEKMEFVSSSAAHSHFLFINTLIFLKKSFLLSKAAKLEDLLP